MSSRLVPRPSPAKRLSSILEQHSPDLKSTSIYLREKPPPQSTKPVTFEGKEHPIKITIDELTESCLMDEKVIKHIQAESPLIGQEELKHRSLLIANDALQRITTLLVQLKQSINEGEQNEPGIASDIDPPQSIFTVPPHSGYSVSGGLESPNIVKTAAPPSYRALVDGRHARPTHTGSIWKASFLDSASASVLADRIFFIEEALDTLDDLITLRKESTQATRNNNLALVTFEALCCACRVIRMLEQFDNKILLYENPEATPTEEPVQTWGVAKHIDMEVTADGSHIGINSVGDSGYGSGQHGSQTRTKHTGDMMEAVSEEEHMDNETIYSLVSVQPEFWSAYIEEFSRCLADDIRLPSSLVRGTGLTFPPSTPQLIKSFARRLHGEASSDAERQVSAFLHQHRGYV